MGGRLGHLRGSRLLIFNVTVSGVVYAAGDHLQQRFECRRRKNFGADWERTGRMVGVGAPIGVMGHYWYLLLDKVLPGVRAGIVVRKVMTDMIIFGPVCLVTYFAGLAIMEGKERREIISNIKTLFPTAYMAEWALWPAAQALNFYIIPSQLRVFYVSSVLLVWTFILSYIKHRVFTMNQAFCKHLTALCKRVLQTRGYHVYRACKVAQNCGRKDFVIKFTKLQSFIVLYYTGLIAIYTAAIFQSFLSKLET